MKHLPHSAILDRSLDQSPQQLCPTGQSYFIRLLIGLRLLYRELSDMTMLTDGYIPPDPIRLFFNALELPR